MPSHKRLTAYTGLLATLACLTLQARRASAEDPPNRLHCGPIVMNGNDFVAINVGNPGHAPTTLLVRLLNSNGGALLEREITLAPGQSQSRTVRLPSTVGSSQILVRGEVVVVTGTPELRILGTLQVFESGLTYGPAVECKIPIANDTPVRPPA